MKNLKQNGRTVCDLVGREVKALNSCVCVLAEIAGEGPGSEVLHASKRSRGGHWTVDVQNSPGCWTVSSCVCMCVMKKGGTVR